MRISLLLAVSCFTLALTGCGGGGGSLSAQTAQPTITPNPVTAVTTPAPAPVQAAKKDCSGNDQNAALEAALISGDAEALDNETVILTDIIGTAECSRTAFNDARAKLFNLETDGTLKPDSLTAINWNPTHDAALLTPVFGQSESVIISNATWDADYVVRNETLTVAGTTGETRHMVMGSHPMRNVYRDASSVNTQMQAFMDNSLAWLTGRDDLKTQPFKVVIAQMADSYYFPDQTATRAWLDTHYGDTAAYNDKTVCNGAALQGCIAAGADILMISQWPETDADIATITQSVEEALAGGIPVLYMHYDGGLYPLGEKLLPLLKTGYLADNYWRRQSLEDYNAAPDFEQLSADVSALKDVFKPSLKLTRRFKRYTRPAVRVVKLQCLCMKL